MADTAISALTELTDPAAGDWIPIVDTTAGSTKKIDWEQVQSATQIPAGTAQTDIQTALSAGGTVIIQPGTYSLTMGGSDYCLIMDASNTHLHLMEGAVLQLAASQIGVGDNGTVLQIGDGSTADTNLTVTGPGVIDANRSNQTDTGQSTPINARSAVAISGPVTDVVIDGAHIKNSQGDGIVSSGTVSARPQRVTVRNNTVTNCAEGILGIRTDYLRIIDNNLDDIDVQDAIEPSSCEHFLIQGNSVENCTQSAIDIFDASYDGVVSGNIINNCVDGITWGGTSNAPRKVVVSNNKISNITVGNGISSIQGGAGVCDSISVVGNVLDNIADASIEVWPENKNILISGNIVKNGAKTGIDVRSTDTIIDSNQIYDFGRTTTPYGILLQTASGCSITNNVIRDRQGESSGFGTTADVNGTTDTITITDHNYSDGEPVTYTKDGGSAVIGLTEAQTYYVNSTGANTFTLHTTAANAVAGTSAVDLTAAGAETHLLHRGYAVGYQSTYGIYLFTTATDNVVSGNTVQDIGNHGIQVDSTATGNTIKNNKVVDVGRTTATSVSVRVEAASTVIKDNECSSPSSLANYEYGVNITNANSCVVQGNYVTDAGTEGVRVGGGTGNVLQGNITQGINLRDQGTNTRIIGNDYLATVGSATGRILQANVINGAWVA